MVGAWSADASTSPTKRLLNALIRVLPALYHGLYLRACPIVCVCVHVCVFCACISVLVFVPVSVSVFVLVSLGLCVYVRLCVYAMRLYARA